MSDYPQRPERASTAPTNSPTELAFPDLVRSLAKAADLVAALEDGPMHKTELAEHVGVSKSTVYNWTSELGEYALVRKTGAGYRLTSLGHLNAEMYFEWRDFATRMHRAQPVLRALPDDVQPPTAALEVASVVSSTEDPDAPMNELIDCLRGATRVTGVFPVASSRFLSALRSHLLDDGTADLVVASAVLDDVRENYPDVCRAVAAGDDSTLLALDDAAPFGLAVFEGGPATVGVASYTAHGHQTGFVRVDAPEAIEWAETTIEEYRAAASAVDLDAHSGADPDDLARPRSGALEQP